MNENNKYDALEDIFRRKLENHQVPVDSSDWEAINSRLQGKPSSKKRTIAVWSAIAASLAIILTLPHLLNDKESGTLPVNPIPAENKSTQAVDSGNSETNPVVLPQQPARNRLVVSSLIHENQIDNDEKMETKDTTTSGGYNQETVVSKQPEKPAAAKLTDQPVHFTLVKKERKELLLAASFGTSHGAGNNTIIQYPQYYDALNGFDGLATESKYAFSNNQLIPDNEDGEYLPPLSFGLTIRKNINARWGIETGLAYTYLSSRYRWVYSETFEATQQLHYLGVPLTGVVYLWNSNSKWNVYFSAGAMLEKGLWMKTSRKQHFPNHTITTTQKSDIDGWQWSLNSSLGISYRLTKKTEFYVEPRISYYFDNEQPMSIRTDWPVSMGVGSGLRYSF